MCDKKLIVALDFNNMDELKDIIKSLDPKKCLVKVGLELYISEGKQVLEFLSEEGFEIFLDLKLHDIPNTVKKSIQELVSLPISMLTIHTSGGKEMMKSAMDAVKGSKIKIFGVTILTSLSDKDSQNIFGNNIKDQVNKMLDLAEDSGIHGIVCSPLELELVKDRKNLLSITPGIRLSKLNDDQKRFTTPKKAIDLGANYIVIGRPITTSNNIGETLDIIYKEIDVT